MLTQTSEIAVKALMHMALSPGAGPFTPQAVAARVGCSPAYLAKTLGQLAKQGILRSRRGAQGGVELARDPSEITLLAIVETCQGLLVANHCESIGDACGPVCAFHRAMWEVREATRETLVRWTLADLVARPVPTGKLAGNAECRVDFLRESVVGRPRAPRGAKPPAKTSRVTRKSASR
jgi:Rrf2 family protein